MDSGSFYRGGSSVTSSLSGSQGHLPPLFTSTPNSSYEGHSPYASQPHAAVDLYAVSQKVDQLLHLVHEQKTQTANLQKTVSSIGEEVREVKQRQDNLERKEGGALSQKKSWKLPPDLSVCCIQIYIEMVSVICVGYTFLIADCETSS